MLTRISDIMPDWIPQHVQNPVAERGQGVSGMTGVDLSRVTHAEELIAFHRLFASPFQRREQRDWSFFYRCGPLANLERKTIEPMILGAQGAEVKAMRALQRFASRG